ncbi:MAG TPA: hypothetical protein VGD01_07750 [Candidatus Elarobacter sp.]|jgi:hypothetical protein
MENFGELFKGIGELFSGIAETTGEGAAHLAVEAAVDQAYEGSDASATVGRYLTGGPRMLNINDL